MTDASPSILSRMLMRSLQRVEHGANARFDPSPSRVGRILVILPYKTGSKLSTRVFPPCLPMPDIAFGKNSQEPSCSTDDP